VADFIMEHVEGYAKFLELMILHNLAGVKLVFGG
jgi:hypothetical protein